MSVEERIITILFLNKINENPGIAKELGIEVMYDRNQKKNHYDTYIRDVETIEVDE